MLFLVVDDAGVCFLIRKVVIVSDIDTYAGWF